jgi:hypothetical protein
MSACLLACLLACLRAYLSAMPACMPASGMPACMPACPLWFESNNHLGDLPRAHQHDIMFRRLLIKNKSIKMSDHNLSVKGMVGNTAPFCSLRMSYSNSSLGKDLLPILSHFLVADVHGKTTDRHLHVAQPTCI